jgi:hypothetical protein
MNQLRGGSKREYCGNAYNWGLQNRSSVVGVRVNQRYTDGRPLNSHL